MNKKILWISLTIVLIIAVSTTVAVFATKLENQSLLTGEKINISNSRPYNIQSQTLSNEKIAKLNSLDSNNLIKKVMNGKEINISEMNVNVYYDNVNSNNNIIQLSNDNIMLEVNNDTGELITFLNKKQNFEKCQLNEEEISLKAVEIFNSLNIEEKDKYEMVFLEKFDDEIWRTGFSKKYDKLVNNGQSVRFSFAPESNEIVTLSINDIKYDNNPIVLTENEAVKIAESIVPESIKNLEHKIYINIVSPNYYFYKNTLKDNEIYKKINVMRKAYVCEFSDESKTQVYIDCTTGEIIGGNAKL